MKKILILAALATLVSTSAFAAITGTKHDLSAYAGVSGEICVFCHTPHGADTSVADAPLWNRTNDTPPTGTYKGIDMQGTPSYVNTDAPLCLSCHDGSVAQTLKNEPNAGITNATGLTMNANMNLGADMTNDHPIGMSLTALGDGEIAAKAVIEAVSGMSGALSYGTNNNMWCSSCHDVHSNTNSPFLRISNTASGLCLTCHLK